MDPTDLDVKQRKALDQFKAELGDAIPPNENDRYLIKWLKARNFNVSKAKHLYSKNKEWRKRIGADTIVKDWTPPEVLVKYYAGCMSTIGYDKLGHPINLDLVSFQDFKGLLRSCKSQDIVKYEVWSIEKSMDDMKEQTKKLGRTIDQFTVIMDLEKIGKKHLRKQYIRCFNDIVQVTEDNYPEYLHKCFIVNAPKIFPAIYSLIKPFLTEDTKKKVIVLGSNWKEKILEYIDADQLPVNWGGTRTDPDGDPFCRSQVCLGGEVPESYYVQGLDSDLPMTTVNINRRQHFTVCVHVAQVGTVIRWQYMTEEYDIGFGVLMAHGDETEKLSSMTEILPIEKVNSHLVPQDGAISCDKVATYVLVFDNRYSLVHSKALSYNVETLGPEEQTDFTTQLSEIDTIRL